MHQVKVEMDQGQQEVINVDELDITSVKTGQTAKITLDAIEGEEFEGTITSVSSEASGGSSSEKYPVEITFNKTDDRSLGNFIYRTKKESCNYSNQCKDQCILNNLIHYFSPPLPNGFGRVTFSINGTRRLLMMIA